MPDIERYMDVGCPHVHLRLNNTVMRTHGLDYQNTKKKKKTPQKPRTMIYLFIYFNFFYFLFLLHPSI